METIVSIIALIILGIIIVPVLWNIYKIRIWEFVKDELEKDAKYRKMAKDMLKGKK